MCECRVTPAARKFNHYLPLFLISPFKPPRRESQSAYTNMCSVSVPKRMEDGAGRRRRERARAEALFPAASNSASSPAERPEAGGKRSFCVLEHQTQQKEARNIVPERSQITKPRSDSIMFQVVSPPTKSNKFTFLTESSQTDVELPLL